MPESPSRIALVTGGNRGIGRAVVESLTAAGTGVILTYRSGAEQAKQVIEDVTARGGRAEAIALDLTAAAGFPEFADAVRATLRQCWGRDSFDILVNNAGFATETALGATDDKSIDQLLGQFKGTYLLTQALATTPDGTSPLLADHGRIINFSTVLTEWVAEPYAVYAALKGAVEVLTRYWAVELGKRGISVNTIAPGPTKTDFAGGYLHHEQAQAYVAGLTALGRVGEAHDVAPAVAALTTGDTGWVTGQRIEVGGGIHL
jgi:NAD(P)-dependent dehydrogenase (short-subunit alcohol dehydrogenase family)